MIGAPLAVAAATAAVATLTAGGNLSPDLDQSSWWRAIPHTPLMSHRVGLSHWWGLPVLAWLFLLPRLPVELSVIGTAAVVGWASHLVADLPFGRLAVFPWGGPKVGLRLKTGGLVETHVVRPVMIGLLVWLLIVRPLQEVWAR